LFVGWIVCWLDCLLVGLFVGGLFGWRLIGWWIVCWFGLIQFFE
jgi:hypothetical protein